MILRVHIFIDSVLLTDLDHDGQPAENNIDDGVAVLLLELQSKVEIWKVGIMECWNFGFHQCIIPLFQDSFEGGNPWLELCKTCA